MMIQGILFVCVGEWEGEGGREWEGRGEREREKRVFFGSRRTVSEPTHGRDGDSKHVLDEFK